MKKYRVYIQSKSGMSEFYKGHVDVSSTDFENAKYAALRKLATGIFKDRGYGAWIINKVERIL